MYIVYIQAQKASELLLVKKNSFIRGNYEILSYCDE